jgi:predicted Rossmann fold nucleotide-binding protein DprA/Smf involved in DNA uptake
MKIAIVGSREFPKLEMVAAFVDDLPAGTVVISGGARGVDTAAEMRARERGLEVMSFPADWDKYGKSAGYRRNKDIVAAADKVVCFHDGASRGALHSANLARGTGKPLYMITWKPSDAHPTIELINEKEDECPSIPHSDVA